jgi:hypothetical protein
MNQVQTIARKHEPDVVVAEKMEPPSAWENATNTGSFPHENTMLLGNIVTIPLFQRFTADLILSKQRMPLIRTPEKLQLTRKRK